MTHVHPAVARIADLATSDPLRRALDWAAHAEGDLADETIRVTEIAAPTFHEERRAVYVAERLQQLGLDDVTIAGDGNVYARFGDGGTPHLALLAHLDTVFAANVGVTVQRRDGRLYAPGVGDNAAGVAGLIGAIEAMRRAGTKPERPVWIVGTVGEEGLGDLSGARAAVSRLRPELSAVVAVEGSFFGRLSHVAVGSRRFRVRFRAEGGHSWHDFGRPSAVHELIRSAATIVALDLDGEPRASINIGEIRGGSGVNVIAECAEMVIDIRSIDNGRLGALAARVRRILEDARRRGVAVTIEDVGDRPAGAIPGNHALVRGCSAILTHLGATAQFAAASTDANAALGQGIPAVTLGVTRGGGAHTLGEWVETGPMVRGVQQLILVLAALCQGAEVYSTERLVPRG